MIIRGNTVGATMPRTNYNQTDSSKPDYLVGREELEKKIAEQIYESSSVALIDVSGNFVLRGSDFPEELCKSEGFQNYLLNIPNQAFLYL